MEKQQPSPEQLAREVEVLRGKLSSLARAQHRVEVEAGKLAQVILAVCSHKASER